MGNKDFRSIDDPADNSDDLHNRSVQLGNRLDRKPELEDSIHLHLDNRYSMYNTYYHNKCVQLCNMHFRNRSDCSGSNGHHSSATHYCSTFLVRPNTPGPANNSLHSLLHIHIHGDNTCWVCSRSKMNPLHNL